MKKLLASFLLLALLLQTAWAGGAAAAFPDTAGHWAEAEIEDMQGRGLLQGYPDGSFRPDAPVTRAELLVVLLRSLEIEANGPTDAAFADVPSTHWAAPVVASARRLGFASGYPNGTFRPDAPMTRAEAAALLYRAYPDVSGDPRAPFPDVPEEHWAGAAIEALAAAGVVNGDPSGRFLPNRTVTRAELSVLLWRILSEPASFEAYVLEPGRWGIAVDGTRPLETTAGLNEALRWAADNGYSEVVVPKGVYLIAKGTKPNDPAARVALPDGIVLTLDDEATFRKEPNGFEAYQLLYIGPDVRRAVVRGGTFQGDRERHDYTAKDHPNSAGTHESGNGIVLEGAANVRIEDVRTIDFTGDGITVGGAGFGVSGLYESAFEAGAIDERGAKAAEAGKIRTKAPVKLDHPIFQTRRFATFWQPSGIAGKEFDVFFYDASGEFLSRLTGQGFGDLIPLPPSAASIVPVFEAKSAKGAFVSFWSNDVSRNVTIANSESAWNRRQGITMGGVDGIVIRGNLLHDIGGTAPGYGIDAEGMGFFPNLNLTIQNNRLYNNRGDIVFADGETALVDGNTFESRIGFFGWEAFRGATLTNNTFLNNGLTLRGDGVARNNEITNGEVVLSGANIVFEDAILTDGFLRIDGSARFGVEASRIVMNNSNRRGNALYLGAQPTKIADLTIQGKTQLFTITGPGSSESVYDRLRVVDYNATNGTHLPAGTYNDCSFASNVEETNGLSVQTAGTYVFQGCEFTANNKLMSYAHDDADVTVRDSTFVLRKDVGYVAAVVVDAVKRLEWEDNTFRAEGLTRTTTPLVKFGRFSNPPTSRIDEAAFDGNTFLTNGVRVAAVDTRNAGADAPPYLFVDNQLNGAVLLLKETDIVQ